MAKIIRVNMSDLQVREEEASKDYLLRGGRGMIAKIMNDEVPPNCDPWGKHNKLIVATGFFSGTGAMSSSRISIGGKSPLTGGIKEANAGGVAGHKLGRLGVLAIVCEDVPREKATYVLKVSSQDSVLEEATALAGLPNYQAVDVLQKRYGNDVGILSIGTAGEMRYANSTVASCDREGRPCRHAARGGLGSVMGSKGIKAIIIDDAEGAAPPIHHQARFREIVREHAQLLREDRGLISLVSTYGVAGAVMLVNEMGALPTRNFRAGRFEGAEKISGEKMAELRKIRGGEMHACMPSCVIGCSPLFLNEKGDYVTSAFEYESLAMLGSNLGIDNIDDIAEMDRLCDDYGLDTIETGSTLAVAAEAGMMDFGNSSRAKELIREMGKGTLLGRLLGQGAVVTARVLGVSRVAAVKGQAMPAHEPRILRCTGVTLATSPMGADHTAGMVFDPAVPTEKVLEVSRYNQILYALVDSTGCCLISYGVPGTAISLIQRMLNSRYSLSLTEEEVLEIGKRVLYEERRFNHMAGINESHNTLPEFFYEEPLPPTDAVLDLSKQEIREIHRC